MVKIIKTTGIVALTALLTACTAHVDGPSGKYSGPGYDIEFNGDGKHHHGKCLPGHHMKGWC